MASVACHMIWLQFFVLFCSFCSSDMNRHHPVILVPGDGGSQLFAKLNRSGVPHWYCYKDTQDFFNIWLNLEEIAFSIDCFVENMILHYNRTSRCTYNSAGVVIRTGVFGDTSTVEYLDPDEYIHHFPQLQYFSPIVRQLLSMNYTRNKDIRAAPYDFRKAPNELGEFYVNLTRLVEETYAANGNRRVVIVAHSMGNPVMLYFYNHRRQSWKDRFIQSHISLAGVWAGAVKPVRLMTSGDSLGVVLVDPFRVRPEQRSMPSTAFLLPSARFWSSGEVLVVTERRNYTVDDLQQLFTDLNYTDGYDMWLDTKDLIAADRNPPNVEVHCLYGHNLDTPGQLRFAPGGFPDTYPETVPDDGDGTVNIRSLRACSAWGSMQKQVVKEVRIDMADHMAIIGHPETLTYISKYLDSINNL